MNFCGEELQYVLMTFVVRRAAPVSVRFSCSADLAAGVRGCRDINECDCSRLDLDRVKRFYWMFAVAKFSYHAYTEFGAATAHTAPYHQQHQLSQSFSCSTAQIFKFCKCILIMMAYMITKNRRFVGNCGRGRETAWNGRRGTRKNTLCIACCLRFVLLWFCFLSFVFFFNFFLCIFLCCTFLLLLICCSAPSICGGGCFVVAAAMDVRQYETYSRPRVEYTNE